MLRGIEELLLLVLLRSLSSPPREEQTTNNRVAASADLTEKVRARESETKNHTKKKQMDPSAVANWASRLPLASKSSAAVILAGYLLQLLIPAIRKYLALVPAR